MKKEFTFGAIGGGFMGYAIVSGAIRSGFIPAEKIFVSDSNEQSLEKFRLLGCRTTTDNLAVADSSEYLLLSVKPQTFPAVAEGLKGADCEKVLSIMAGVEKSRIRALLPRVKGVCRAMPNLPCSIGSGMIAADVSDFSDEKDRAFFAGLFSSLGKYVFTEESKMHAVTGISGSGPAYVFLFINSLIEAGKQQGLSQTEAELLAVQTVAGGVDMYYHEKDTTNIDTLIARGCSKGGTTERAMQSFYNDDFEGTVARAVDACARRSAELSK